jgi:serine/threonine protein kinase
MFSTILADRFAGSHWLSATPSAQWDQTETAQLWQAVAECVESFIEAWESASEPPRLAIFAPAGTSEVRRLALIELIKVDLEYRSSKGQPERRIEEYLVEFPEIVDAGLPVDLVYEEFHIRRRKGDEVTAKEYLERFPEYAGELQRMLELEAANLSTTLFTGEKTAAIDIEERIDDFDILAQLGKGAFATVYLARQRSMQRIVALKVSADRGLEAQTLAQLDHPHIVRVYDQRVLEDRGLRLLYMQYVAGGTLQPVVDAVRGCPERERSGKLLLEVVDRALDLRGESPPSDSTVRQRLKRATWGEAVCWIGARLATALEYAHRHGVLHRDVKPANVLLAADGTPKLVDFNIACCSKVEGATPAAYFGGSLAYMSPEQLEACNPAHERQPDELDGRSEVFSLGVLLWELLCGWRPFADESIRGSWPQLLTRMVEQRRAGLATEALCHLPGEMPPGLAEVLLKALAPESAQRHASAGEMAAQLELCLRPSAQRLMLAPRRSWRQWVARNPTFALAAAAVVPNVALSALNVKYNVPTLIEPLPESAQKLFYDVQLGVVNGLLYTLALAAGIALCWPVLRAVKEILRGNPGPAALSLGRRLRSLSMGDYVFAVTLAAWAMSGVIFPVWLRLHVGEEQSFSPAVYLHFLVSQLLFGLVAGTLAYFFVTFLTVRALHPLLIKCGKPEEGDAEGLGRLSQRVWRYFAVAVAVPFLALAVLFWIDSEQRWAFGALSVMGLCGFAVSFALARAIQADLRALALAMAPPGETLPGESQSFDRFGG